MTAAAFVCGASAWSRNTRRKGRKARGESVTDVGLRYGPEEPVEVIKVKAPEIEAISEEYREVIGKKITHRLAQRPGSYAVMAYRRLMVKD